MHLIISGPRTGAEVVPCIVSSVSVKGMARGGGFYCYPIKSIDSSRGYMFQIEFNCFNTVVGCLMFLGEVIDPRHTT